MSELVLTSMLPAGKSYMGGVGGWQEGSLHPLLFPSPPPEPSTGLLSSAMLRYLLRYSILLPTAVG